MTIVDVHVDEKDPRYPMTRVSFTDGRHITYHRTVARDIGGITYLWSLGHGRVLPSTSFPTTECETWITWEHPS